LRWPHRARYTDTMTDETHARNIALLIDADNASSSTLDPVLTILAELGTVNIRRVMAIGPSPHSRAGAIRRSATGSSRSSNST